MWPAVSSSKEIRRGKCVQYCRARTTVGNACKRSDLAGESGDTCLFGTQHSFLSPLTLPPLCSVWSTLGLGLKADLHLLCFLISQECMNEFLTKALSFYFHEM